MPIDLLRRLLPWAAVALLFAWLGHALTANHYRAVIAEKDAAADRALAEAQQHVIQVQKTQQQITDKVATDYETKIRQIRSAYADTVSTYGVRVDTTDTRGLRPVPDTAGKLNGPASCNGLSWRLRQAADEQTQQLIYLQQWVREQATADR